MDRHAAQSHNGVLQSSRGRRCLPGRVNRFQTCFALQDQRVRGFDAFLAVVNVDDAVLCDHALMYAEDADFAYVGIVHYLEDLSNERQILIRHGL